MRSIIGNQSIMDYYSIIKIVSRIAHAQILELSLKSNCTPITFMTIFILNGSLNHT